jgi:hypothetical protein
LLSTLSLAALVVSAPPVPATLSDAAKRIPFTFRKGE